MSLKFPHKMSPRKFKWTFGCGSGPSERIKRLRMTVTGLIRHERIESTFSRCDETRGYAERLIQMAMKNGDKDKYAMEMADYWLLEKDLIHKLFKVLIPRYEKSHYAFASYTQLYMLPPNVPGRGIDMAVLELKGNPWPPVIPKQRDTKYFLTNMLIDGLKKDYEKAKRSPLVNRILQESSTDHIDIDSIQKQYIEGSVTGSQGEFIVDSGQSTKTGSEGEFIVDSGQSTKTEDNNRDM